MTGTRRPISLGPGAATAGRAVPRLDRAREFLEDAEADISSAGALIGDDAEKNRVAFRLLVEGTEKAIKALWLAVYDEVKILLLDPLKARCSNIVSTSNSNIIKEIKELGRELDSLADPKKLGHETSLTLPGALLDALYHAGCVEACRLRPEDLSLEKLLNSFREYLDKYDSRIAESIVRSCRLDAELDEALKAVGGKVENSSDLSVELAKEIKSFNKRQFKTMIRNVRDAAEAFVSSVQKVDCNQVKKAIEIKEQIQKAMKGEEKASELCEKGLDANRVGETIKFVSQLLSDAEKEKAEVMDRLIAGVQVVLEAALNELRARRVKEILNITEMTKIKEKIIKCLIGMYTVRAVYSVYLLCALVALHLTIYPCYRPSRYRYLGSIPSDVLDKAVLKGVHGEASKIVARLAELLQNKISIELG